MPLAHISATHPVSIANPYICPCEISHPIREDEAACVRVACQCVMLVPRRSKKHETRHNHDMIRGWPVMSHEPAIESPGNAYAPDPRQNAAPSPLLMRLGTVGRWLARIVLL